MPSITYKQQWTQAVVPPLGTPVNLNHPRLRDCAYWQPFFNGQMDGPDLIDGLKGTINGDPSTVGSRFGLVPDLDGVGDFIDLGEADSLFENRSIISCSMWFRTTGSSDKLMGQSAGGINVTFTTESAGKFVRWRIAGATAVNANSSTVINDGNWHHVAGTYNGTANIILYLDGHVEKVGGAGPTSVGSTSANVQIGALNGNAFPGQLADVRIYHRVLTLADVSSLFAFPFLEFQTRRYLTIAVPVVGGVQAWPSPTKQMAHLLNR